MVGRASESVNGVTRKSFSFFTLRDERTFEKRGFIHKLELAHCRRRRAFIGQLNLLTRGRNERRVSLGFFSRGAEKPLCTL